MIWLMLLGWIILSTGFIASEGEKVLCQNIDVVFSDTLSGRFVSENSLRAVLAETGIPLQGYPLQEINSRKLEQELEKNPYIRNAEVSKDVSGRLEVSVDERIALVRVMPAGKQGYYLDTEGKVLPLSSAFVPRILLASGYFPRSGEKDDQGRLEELYRFAGFVSEHPLWRDQIVQIYLGNKGNYELIPRVGAHQVLLGSMDNWERKLENLELLYRQAFPKYGWNNYSVINLKYTNQVICTKR